MVDPPTFTRDIARLVFEQCAYCHRPGESGPFPLLTYEDVAGRAEQILEVTQSRYMPPWPPEHGHAEFQQERRLSEAELAALRDWVKAGTPQGNPADLPELPRWKTGWYLGEPDLVVTLQSPFQLSADGTDVYRNFVLPVTLDEPRYVHAVEIQPQNTRVAHHAYVRVDHNRTARALDELDPGPGFGAMEGNPGIESPAGCILGWQVGKVPSFEPEGVAWQLKPGMDLVMELHMQPSGKLESVQPRIGLYFTDEPPKRTPFLIKLLSTTIDIPAGEREYVVRMEYTLPVPVKAMAVMPHAHYLGKVLEAYAELPSGEHIWLIRIPDWDFAWQGDYRYKVPLQLPRGAKLVMNYTYDNSPENVRNPHSPPQRVQYGTESKDEMGELSLQVIVESQQDLQSLQRDYSAWKFDAAFLPLWRKRLESATTSAEIVEARTNLAKAQFAVGRPAVAWSHLVEAVKEPAVDASALYLYGFALAQNGRLSEAENAFHEALALDLDHVDGHNGMGIILLERQRFEEALGHFQRVVDLQPFEATGYLNLGRTLWNLERREQAVAAFEQAVRLDPESERARQLLRQAQGGP